MKKHIYSEKDDTLVKVVEAQPTCHDFCETCGNCLSCYWEDKCTESDDGEHYWVEYQQLGARDGLNARADHPRVYSTGAAM